MNHGKKEPTSSTSLLRSHPLEGDDEFDGIIMKETDAEKELRSYNSSENSFERLTMSSNPSYTNYTSPVTVTLPDEEGDIESRTRTLTKFSENNKSDIINLIYRSPIENKQTAITLNGMHVLNDDADDYYEEEDEESQCLNPEKKSRKMRSNSNKSNKSKRSFKQSLFTKPYGDSDAEEASVTPSPTPSNLDEALDHPERRANSHTPIDKETSFSIFIQVFFPFLIGGFGTVGAGLVLDYVQHWEVFKKVSQVFILVPALLGLKGNLEMTLASRLSTAANLGLLDSFENQWKMSVGNIALVQSQAAVVGFLAAAFAILMDWLPEGNLDWSHATLLVASSLLTASIASFLLAILMIFVVIVSHRCHINPDNVATPIAASLGDLTTLALLANISSLLFYTVDNSLWLCLTLIFVLLALIPVFTLVAHSNPFTRDVLYYGWSPVISAMAISSVGGIILDFAVSRFSGIAVFQPVINGVGGNLVAVQASRISTYLHQRSCLGILPDKDSSLLCVNPFSTFLGSHSHAKTARVLLLISIPGHLMFTYGIHVIQAGHTSITPIFLVVYLTSAMIQIMLLLTMARSLILYMWRKKIDPDNSAIPYLTAIGDLLGTALLALAFLLLYEIGDKDTDVGD
jgi:solute carrier family 41